MQETILYLQANEQIAKSIKNEFDPDSIEVLTAISAEEAFVVYNERQVTLTLVDTFVPDMKLKDFIDKCANEYPDMILNVCVDIDDSGFIGNLTRRRNVKKIHTVPWEIAEIVEGVNASIDAALITRDFYRRKAEIEQEEAEFEATLSRLKESLKRQQYSYNTLEPFLNGILKSFEEKSSKDSKLIGFMNICCEKMLKLQTTTTIKPEILGKTIEECITELAKEFGDLSLGEFDNCIFGDVPKNRLADIVFCVWLCVYLEAIRGKRGRIDIYSRYITSSKCEIKVVLRSWESEDSLGKYDTYVMRLLTEITDEYDFKVENGDKVYELRTDI